jgi:hypothetical protein
MKLRCQWVLKRSIRFSDFMDALLCISNKKGPLDSVGGPLNKLREKPSS